MYTHLTRDDRAVIAQGLQEGISHAVIGERLCRDASTMTREIRRNKEPNGSYRADRAQQRADSRRVASKYGTRKLENNERLAQDTPVACATIYAWLKRSRPDLKQRLPRRGKRRRRYGSKRQGYQGWTRSVRHISERPCGARSRRETKHFEGDTIRGVRTTKTALLTHTDRKSRFEMAQKIKNEGADAGHAAMVKNRHLKTAKSITYDRGGTFALWRMMEKDTSAKIFFADPRSPWQRGTNENSNERLRRVYPKGTDFAMVSQKDIDRTVWTMNHTKRKCLDWRTPCEVYGECCTSS